MRTDIQHVKGRVKGSSFTSSSKEDEGCSMNHTRMTVSRRRCCSLHLHNLPSVVLYVNCTNQLHCTKTPCVLVGMVPHHKKNARGQKDKAARLCVRQRGTLNNHIQQRCVLVAFLVVPLVVEVVSTFPFALLLLLPLPS